MRGSGVNGLLAGGLLSKNSKHLGPELSCIAAAAASTLHAVGFLRRSRTLMPLARGAAPVRRDPPETRRHLATKDEDGRAPHIAVGAGDAARGNAVFLRHRRRLCSDLDAFRKHPGL